MQQRGQDGSFWVALSSEVGGVVDFLDKQRNDQVLQVTVHISWPKLNMHPARDDLNQLVVLLVFPIIPARHSAIVSNYRNIAQ